MVIVRITGFSLPWCDAVGTVGLPEPWAAWTGTDHERRRSWFSEHLAWLQTSRFGQRERERPNKRGMWYDVQVVSYALFVDDE